MAPSDLLALKNAWKGAVATSDRVREAAAAVEDLPETAELSDSDLEAYHALVLANSIAVMALRGLIEEIRRRRASVSS